MTAIPMPAAARRPLPAKSQWFGGSMPAARAGVILNLVVPGGVLIWDAVHHQLGINAVNFAIKTTGLIAVTYLVLSLVVSPLKSVSGFTWLVQFRRAIGVYAFYYAAAHLAIYFWWDRGASVSSTASEIWSRNYLLIGFGSLSLMFPLWATSFNAAIRWMGGRNWKRLHRLAYVSAALACYHYYLQSKADKSKPDIYIAILGALLLWRMVAGAVQWTRRPRRTAAAASSAVAGKARFWKGELKVIGMFTETPSVRTFRLAMPDGSAVPFTFKAGQFLTLTATIDGKRVSRSYTIASSPTRDAYIELSIKREDKGHVSRYLHEMLMTGQSVAVAAPAGRFIFDPSSRERGVALIAGGVGITPAMSIVRDLTDRGWPGAIDLLMVARTRQDIIFADELKLLESRHKNLHVHYWLTRETAADGCSRAGHPTAESIARSVTDLQNRPAYICGPDAMAADVQKMLVSLGVPADRITVESFTPAAAVAKDAGRSSEKVSASTETVSIAFARSSVSAAVEDQVTVLEAAESVGVSIDYQCRAGVCGTCRCKLLEGQVSMDVHDALSEEDERDGYILTCQARAVGDVVIDA